MPEQKAEAPKPNELADAIVGAVHAGQALRRAARGRLISEAKTVLETAGKVASALGDL
ncbi:MAG: hypothetical protein IVW52_04905 [Acidimicrobiales bacterium]|nr:hypothetical protein [Acidimicrobiales bacterium]